MDLAWYKRLRSACAARDGVNPDPDTWIPDPGDQLFGIRIDVRGGGGEPHLEVAVFAADSRNAAEHDVLCGQPLPAGATACSCGWSGHGTAYYDAATRTRMAYPPPPPLGKLGDDVMLAVALVKLKIPEEWQDEGAWPFVFAWPHAAGVPESVHAVELMTAAQLRALLAARDAGHV